MSCRTNRSAHWAGLIVTMQLYISKKAITPFYVTRVLKLLLCIHLAVGFAGYIWKLMVMFWALSKGTSHQILM